MSAPLKLEFTEAPRDILLRPGTPASAGGSQVRNQAEEAYERGRRDAEEALNDQIMEQRRELIDLQQGVFQSLQNTIPTLIREGEQAMAELALEVARKLVASLPISAEMLERAIQEALDQLEESSEFHIYLNPQDLDLLKNVDSELLIPKPHTPALHFHPADDVGRGGCLVRTRFGILDASRENKLQILKEAVLS